MYASPWKVICPSLLHKGQPRGDVARHLEALATERLGKVVHYLIMCVDLDKLGLSLPKLEDSSVNVLAAVGEIAIIGGSVYARHVVLM